MLRTEKYVPVAAIRPLLYIFHRNTYIYICITFLWNNSSDSFHAPQGQLVSARTLRTTRHTVTAAHARSSVAPRLPLAYVLRALLVNRQMFQFVRCRWLLFVLCGECVLDKQDSREKKKKKKILNIFASHVASTRVFWSRREGGCRIDLNVLGSACRVARPRASEAGWKVCHRRKVRRCNQIQTRVHKQLI